MEKPILKVKKREKVGKAETRRLRRKGFIPAILYGSHIKGGIPLQIEVSQLSLVFSSLYKGDRIITLQFTDGEKEEKREAIIKETQYNWMKGRIEHLDFYEIKRGERISTEVPLRLSGEDTVTKKGGVIEQMVREIEVECLPENIPAHIDVDLREFKIGDSLKIKDLQIPQGVKVIANPEEIVLSILSPISEEEIEKLEEEKGVEAEEVEVVERGKKEETKEEETKKKKE